MKKTFLQRFFLPLCLLTLFGMWGGSHAWAEELVIDFENPASSYSADWTLSKMTSQQTGAISAHGGTYYGTTGGNASASITTATALPYPSSISFYVSKETNNTKSSSWKIQVSSDNSKWDDVKTQSATSMSKGSWVEVTQDLSKYDHVYVRVSYTGSTAIRNIDDLKIIYSTTGSVTPTLNVSKTALSFSEVETSSSASSDFTLSGSNLSADATLAISGANADMFSVSPTNVSQTDGSIADTKVTVTYKPTAVGEHVATLTVSSTGATDKTITLSGTAIAPLTHYTVNWMVNGAAYTEGAPSTNVAEGSKVSALPTTPAAIGDKAFMGWTNAAISGTQDAAPAMLFTTAAEAPAVTANTTYYAVFADATPVSNTWKRIKNLADITEGSYVIKNDAYVLPSTTTGSSTPPAQVSAPEITDENITGTVEESMIWQFTTTGTANQFFIKNAEGNYLYATNANNGVRVGDTEDKWTFDVNTADYFSMQEAKNNRYCAAYSPSPGTDWRSYITATHANYRNGGKLELYKYESVYSYSAYATHFATLSERNLAFSASAVETFGSSVAAPTLTGHTDGVTYESSDPEVASVDAHTGAVTVGTKLGTTTIKASAAKDANYYAGEASYELSVWPTSIAGLKTLITGTTPVDFKVQLNNAIITYVDGDNAYMQDANAGILIYLSDHGLTAGKSYTGVASGTATIYKGLREITSIDWGTITPVDATIPTAMEVTVADLQDNYDAFESMYVCVKDANVASALSGKNASISQVVDEDKKEYAVYDKNGSLGSTALSSKTAIVSVYGFPGVFNTTYQLNVYNAAAVEETGYNLAVSAAGYATYFNSTKAYTLPADVKGHVWNDGLVNAYAAESVVPANEPLVIEAAKGNYALMFTTTTNEVATTNVLEGTDEATALTDDPSYYYYGLSLNASSELSSVGFYWMNPTGAAFTNGAHKAYLKLAKANFSPSMVMSAFPFNGSATGIDHIATGADTTKTVYDLSGRRVNKAIKGIYIVNGKKVLVK